MRGSSPRLGQILDRVLRRTSAVVVGILIGIVVPASANAAVAENLLTFNAKAFSLGNAVTADYVGVDSLQYNPAALVNLRSGFTTEFKMLAAPLVQVVRKNSPRLTPSNPEFTLFFRGYTVKCDSALRPFGDLGAPNYNSPNPGRDPVTGGLDPSIPTLNFDFPSDVCFGPELVNPNGIFTDDPIDDIPADIDRIVPIPLPLPLYIPNIGYKQTEDSRIAVAAQFFTTAPVPKLDVGSSIIDAIGIQRLTFTPGFAFQVTDKLSIGAALRVSKAFLQVGVFLNGNSQLFGFFNAAIHDLCQTNEGKRNRGNPNSARLYDDFLNCTRLYANHQERVDSGLARESGYWPFLPWDDVAQVNIEGQTALTYGWNLGVQWKPMPWITWGATYRTKEDDVYDMDGRIYYSEGIQAIFSGIRTVPVLGLLTDTLLLDGSESDRIAAEVGLPWPAAFSTGVSMQLMEKLKLNVEYRKYMYGLWKNLDVQVTSTDLNAIRLLGLINPNNTGQNLDVPLGGKDSSYYAFGMEYQWNKRLAYRFGYEDRPFLDGDGLLPVNGIQMVSIGSEYKLTFDRVVDVALTRTVLDASGPGVDGGSIAQNPFGAITLRGASYDQVQLDAGILMFTMSYSHRF